MSQALQLDSVQHITRGVVVPCEVHRAAHAQAQESRRVKETRRDEDDHACGHLSSRGAVFKNWRFNN